MKYLITAFLLLTASVVNATTITYFLDNVFIDTTRDQADQQMTGTFNWTYTEGNFEDGVGVFTDLYVPNWVGTIDDLDIGIDVASAIEFSLKVDRHNTGIDVILVLSAPLTPTSGVQLDLDGSQYSVNDSNGDIFVSGAVTPTVVPIPPAVWLFGSGLLGLVTVARRKHK